MQVRDNTILITGGGRGIGRGLAEALHAEGNQVIIAGRGKKALEETVSANPGMKAAALDMSDGDTIVRFAEQMKRDYPALNIVVLNAGIMRTESVQRGGLADAEATVATNLLGPIRLTASLLPMLLSKPRAAIMTLFPFSSYGSTHGYPMLPPLLPAVAMRRELPLRRGADDTTDAAGQLKLPKKQRNNLESSKNKSTLQLLLRTACVLNMNVLRRRSSALRRDEENERRKGTALVRS